MFKPIQKRERKKAIKYNSFIQKLPVIHRCSHYDSCRCKLPMGQKAGVFILVVIGHLRKTNYVNWFDRKALRRDLWGNFFHLFILVGSPSLFVLLQQYVFFSCIFVWEQLSRDLIASTHCQFVQRLTISTTSSHAIFLFSPNTETYL